MSKPNTLRNQLIALRTKHASHRAMRNAVDAVIDGLSIALLDEPDVPGSYCGELITKIIHATIALHQTMDFVEDDVGCCEPEAWASVIKGVDHQCCVILFG